MWYFHAQGGKTQKCRSFARGSGNKTEGPRIPSCCIRPQTQSTSSQIFFSHVMFYSCRCHFTARVHRRAAVLWTGNLPEKCSSVVQSFWFTSTRGHKQMQSLVSGSHHNEPCAGWTGTSTFNRSRSFGKNKWQGFSLYDLIIRDWWVGDNYPDLLLLFWLFWWTCWGFPTSALMHGSSPARCFLLIFPPLTQKHSLISSTLIPKERILMSRLHLEKLVL